MSQKIQAAKTSQSRDVCLCALALPGKMFLGLHSLACGGIMFASG